jgi:hypothetical protein
MAALRPVPQKHSYGCGVSALAVLKNWSYDKAHREIVATFPKFDPKTSRGLLRKELVSLLEGWQLRRGATHEREFARGSVVLITVDGVTHYLVFDGAEWLDSLDEPLTRKNAKKNWKSVPKTGGRIRRLPRDGVSDLYLAPPSAGVRARPPGTGRSGRGAP